MIYSIYSYGCGVLRKKAESVEKINSELHQLIKDMFETMYASSGVGLAAPQIGISKRIFVIDSTPFNNGEYSHNAVKKVFINPKIIEESGEKWKFNEGCLSIPNIHEDVLRNEKIKICYYDLSFNFIEEEYNGVVARIIQHEYDHLNGTLFIDHLSSIKKVSLKNKLNQISKGNFKVSYKMKYCKN